MCSTILYKDLAWAGIIPSINKLAGDLSLIAFFISDNLNAL